MYEPRWDIDYRTSHPSEHSVAEHLTGLALGTIEVKQDARAATTGNLFVEYQCVWHDGTWHPSGIATTEAEAWAFLLPPMPLLLILPTASLRVIARAAHAAGKTATTNKPGDIPTRGALVPLADLLTLATTENNAA